MTLVTLSYFSISKHADPFQWLRQIDFFTGTLEELSLSAKVHSFHHIGYRGLVEQNGVQYHFTNLSQWNLLFPFALHKTIRVLNPDAIIIQGFQSPFQSLLLRLSLGKKVQLWIQHHADQPHRFHKKYFQILLDKFIIGYFFTSRELAAVWIKSQQISKVKKIVEVMECSSVYYPIDRIQAKTSTGLSGTNNYLWVGRLENNKDPIKLITSFIKFLTIHPQAKLYVVYQQDDLLPEVTLLTKNIPNIILIGKQDKEQLLNWYNSAEFIISTSHYEGSGIAVCEAMSCGCIPILSSIPSFRWMTENGKCGLLFDNGETMDLFQALRKSVTLNVREERSTTIDLFNDRLSFRSIAKTMLAAILSHQ